MPFAEFFWRLAGFGLAFVAVVGIVTVIVAAALGAR